MRAVWALADAALGGLGLVITRRLTAPVTGRMFDLTIRDVDNSGERTIVVLDRSPRNVAPGHYCLILEDAGWVKLSPEVYDRGPLLVGREVAGEPRESLGVSKRSSWSGIFFASPADAGLEATHVEAHTDVGPAPAWLIT